MSRLAAEGDPATALFEFFTSLVEQAAGRKTVVGLLASTGTDVQVAGELRSRALAVIFTGLRSAAPAAPSAGRPG